MDEIITEKINDRVAQTAEKNENDIYVYVGVSSNLWLQAKFNPRYFVCDL